MPYLTSLDICHYIFQVRWAKAKIGVMGNFDIKPTGFQVFDMRDFIDLPLRVRPFY